MPSSTSLHGERLVRPLGVEFLHEGVEAALPFRRSLENLERFREFHVE
jgi:hypothetical protein